MEEVIMGGSGGGSSSGKVSHSDYLETIHSSWLSHMGVDTTSSSITDVMDSALGNSPWTGLSAYNPDADITAFENGLSDFLTILTGLSDTVDWATLYAQAETSINGPGDALIAADIAAFEAQLDDNVITRILPRFRRGMQDINAVVSSSFVIGESIIEAFQARDVAKYSSALYIDNNSKKLMATEQIINMMSRRIGWRESYARMLVDSKRIKIVAKKEQIEADTAIDEHDAKWDLEVFQYGGNLMAAIGGGTAIPNMAGKSKTASAIGGAMTGGVLGGMIAGAQAGGMAGNPYTVVAGAVIGAAAGYLSS